MLSMARYYFHLRDGETILDGEGIDLPDLVAVRRAALATSTEILGSIKAGPAFWSGEPWTLWVTDGPNGGGANVLTLQFSVTEANMRASEKVGASDLREIMATGGNNPR